MRSKFKLIENVNPAVVEAPAKMPRGERTSHPEYPLERVCSHRYEPFPNAHVCTKCPAARPGSRGRGGVPSHQGLAIRAETEDSIDAAIVLLKDLYGPTLRIGPPTIRYHRGRMLEQPWMGLSVRCGPEHLEAVNADLVDREAVIVSCEIDPAQSVIEARAPLAALLGYRSGSRETERWLGTSGNVAQPLCAGGESAARWTGCVSLTVTTFT